MLTYAFIMLQEDPSLEKIRGSYVMLRHNFEYITKEFDKAEILEVGKQFLKYADEMQIEKDFKPTTTPLCNYCSFLEHCEEGKIKTNYVMNNTTGEVDW